MKKLLSVLTAGLILAVANTAQAALMLSGGSYSQNFDSIGTALPAEWTANTGASVSAPGTAQTFATAQNTWGNTGGDFKNVASSDGLTSGSSTTAQGNSTDRAFGIRQTESFGDPGAAFVLAIDNTTGYGSFAFSIKLQMLNVQDRSTTWTIDYRVGNSGNFTALGTYTDPGIFGSTTISSAGLGADLSSWNNQGSTIYFRIAALSASTGSNNRDTFAIDDFDMTFTAVPEPATWAGLIFGGLFCGTQFIRRYRAGASRA